MPVPGTDPDEQLRQAYEVARIDALKQADDTLDARMLARRAELETPFFRVLPVTIADWVSKACGGADYACREHVAREWRFVFVVKYRRSREPGNGVRNSTAGLSQTYAASRL
jgi:hypothetical protein